MEGEPRSSELAVTPHDQKRAHLAQLGKAAQLLRQRNLTLSALGNSLRPWSSAVCCGAAPGRAGPDTVLCPPTVRRWCGLLCLPAFREPIALSFPHGRLHGWHWRWPHGQGTAAVVAAGVSMS